MASDPLRSGFTRRFSNRARVLDSDIGISEAYKPAANTTPPAIERFTGVWDTGASGSVITSNVVAKLGLQPIDQQKQHTVSGDRIAGVYLVNIYLPNNVVFPGLRVMDGNILGGDILVGMDIIGQGDLAVTNPNGQTCMSFQIPSQRSIDFVQEINRANRKKPGTRPGKSGRKKPRRH